MYANENRSGEWPSWRLFRLPLSTNRYKTACWNTGFMFGNSPSWMNYQNSKICFQPTHWTLEYRLFKCWINQSDSCQKSPNITDKIWSVPSVFMTKKLGNEVLLSYRWVFVGTPPFCFQHSQCRQNEGTQRWRGSAKTASAWLWDADHWRSVSNGVRLASRVDTTRLF